MKKPLTTGFERFGKGPFGLDPRANRGDDARIAAAQAPIRKVRAAVGHRRICGADPGPIADDGQLLGVLADANSHALANQAVQNRALPVVATQVAFGNDQSRRQAFARQCFERRMNRVATPKRLGCHDDAIVSAGIS